METIKNKENIFEEFLSLPKEEIIKVLTEYLNITHVSKQLGYVRYYNHFFKPREGNYYPPYIGKDGVIGKLSSNEKVKAIYKFHKEYDRVFIKQGNTYIDLSKDELSLGWKEYKGEVGKITPAYHNKDTSFKGYNNGDN